MRPLTCLAFLLVIFCSTANAQTDPQKFRFGVKAGVNLSWFTNDVDLMDNPDQRFAGFREYMRISPVVGVTADRQISKRIIFGAELQYNARGANYREENYNVPVTYDQDGDERRSYNYLTYRFDYIELPLTLGVNFLPQTSNTIVLGYAGIAPGLLINHKRKLNYDSRGTDLPDQKLDMRYGKDIITSLVSGVKVMESKTEGVAVYGDLRGSYTLSPVFSRNYTDAGRNLDTRMITVSLALGIRL